MNWVKVNGTDSSLEDFNDLGSTILNEKGLNIKIKEDNNHKIIYLY